MHLHGKTAIVTGGGTGIGKAIALALASEGALVGIAGRRADVLEQTAAQSQGPHPIQYHIADVAKRESVQELFAWARSTLGEVDILVCAAGVNIPNRSMAEMPPEEWDRVLAINASGPYYCFLEALPGMRARRDGLIVNISSVSGKRASALGGVAYCAAKFAQTALGTAVSLEAGKDNVRVTNIYPGEVDTPILAQRPKPVSDEHRAKILQPEDVAAAVMMVAKLPARAHVAELVIKPVWQDYA